MPIGEPTDSALATRAWQGDHAAMETLYHRHAGPLMAFLRLRTPDADDVFQETWIRAIRYLRRFKRGSFRAWLIVIGRNIIIDRYRRDKPADSLDAPYKGELPAPVEFLADPSPAALEQMASDEALREIGRAVDSLPAPQREVFLLRTQQELTFKEIAELLDIPINTALGRMHTAVTKLRAKLSHLL